MAMRRSLRQVLVSAATLPLALGAVSLTTGSATAAVVQPHTCTHPSWSDKDPTNGHAIDNGTPVRTGPYSACGAVVTVGSGVTLHYHCSRRAAKGYTGTSLRDAAPNMAGWVLAPPPPAFAPFPQCGGAPPFGPGRGGGGDRPTSFRRGGPRPRRPGPRGAGRRGG